MATYKLIGQRNLRKYTEAKTSPTYAAAIEAQTIVDSLCQIPWKKVSARDATMTYHTEETVAEIDGQKINGLEMNVRIRDEFDAALFCADHSGGQHRAYANAAVYHYVLPDGALPKLTRLVAKVTSDPYNSAGARISILTNSTGVIPTNCNECRTGDAHADGVAPRTVAANRNWFPTMADCVFSSTPGEGETALPSGGLQLQKHLFVFVLMESYSTVRGNWLEGCSFIKNKISIETDAAIQGWTDGETYDLTTNDASGFVIVKDGILPCIPGAAPVGEIHVAVRADANPIIEDDGSQTPIRTATGDKAAAAIGRIFSAFYSGNMEISRPGAGPSRPRGAAFNITRTTEPHVSSDSDLPVDTDVLRIDSTALVVPFAYPRDFTPARVVLTLNSQISTLKLSPGARFNVFVAEGYLTSLTDEQLKNPGLYDGEGAPFTLLGTIESGTRATFDLPASTARVGTIVITGWLPPDRYDIVTGGSQGTGDVPFLPDIKITE